MTTLVRLLSFDARDVDVRGAAGKRFQVKMYGIDEARRVFALDVNDFEPYFYARATSPCSREDAARFVSYVRELVDLRTRHPEKEVLGGRLEESRKLYGFDDGAVHPFVKLTFASYRAFCATKALWFKPGQRGTLRARGLKFEDGYFELYEAHIPPLVRLFHEKGINPSGWIGVPTKKLDASARMVTGSLARADITAQPDNDARAEYTVCSFDIEASSSDGDFPLAKKTYSKLAREIVARAASRKATEPSDVVGWVRAALDGESGFDRPHLKAAPRPGWPDELVARLKCAHRPRAQGGADAASDGDNGWDSESTGGSDDGSDSDGSAASAPAPTPRCSAAFRRPGTTLIRHVASCAGYNKAQKDELVAALDGAIGESLGVGVAGDTVTYIGSVFFRLGEPDCFLKHCAVLGGCSDIDGVEIASCESERDVLVAWTDLVQRVDPDILIGYNTFGFDWKFMHDRAGENRCADRFMQLSRRKSEVCRLEEKKTKLASGEHHLFYANISGRIQFDLHNLIRREYNLSSYKLDDVAAHFIGDAVTAASADGDRTVVATNNTYGLYDDAYVRFEIIDHSSTSYMNGKKFAVARVTPKSFVIACGGGSRRTTSRLRTSFGCRRATPTTAPSSPSTVSRTAACPCTSSTRPTS